jgi:BMFP domain-containing protein YqiC
MHDLVTREEMERLERTVQRVFARVSFLEARVNELERELAATRLPVSAMERPQLVEALGRTA